MAEIRWTEESRRWLFEIHSYIAEDNPKIANRVINDIYNKTQILLEFPQIGYKFRSETDGEIRIMLYGHYRIAYLIKHSNDIDILGVFHGALDIEKYLP